MKRFENNSKVCFVGDSITHTGLFIKFIVDHYRCNFPGSGVEFYDCGISGGTLGNTIKVFHEDIAIYDPTHIVLMIGINDSDIGCLDEGASKEKYEKLFAAFETYKNNLECFYNITRERDIELILCTPTPYAEYIESDVKPLRGGYALLQGYAAFVRKFAAERGIALCDYHTAVTKAMQSENLYNADRVHPTQKGHMQMAKTFLEFQGLELAEKESYPLELEEWYAVVQKLRNIIATEYFNIPGYTDMDSGERSAIIQKLYDGLKAGTYETTPYFASLIDAYPENKKKQAEYIEFVKHFMRGGR